MNTNRIGRWSIIIGIVIVLNLFFNYALSLAYKSPEFTDFCPNSQVINIPETENACVSQGGQWTSNPAYGKPVPVGGTQYLGSCDLQYTCRQSYDDAYKTYSRNVFIILIILGAVAVAVGNFAFATNEVISSGLSLAGVLSFIIASGRYWGSSNDWTKLFILAVALGLLFWVAVKKFNERIRSEGN